MSITIQRCADCEAEAAVFGVLCRACKRDNDHRDSIEFALPNFEYCSVCNGQLRRGHCYDCIDRANGNRVVCADCGGYDCGHLLEVGIRWGFTS